MPGSVGPGSSAARPPRALVAGGGISGLVAALELRRAGLEVTVLEAGARWGGCIGEHEVAGLTLDSGAESFATRTDAVRTLVQEVGLGGDIVAPHPAGAWVLLPDGPRELPKTGVLGIPANPWDPEVRKALGLRGSVRASLDRWLPVRKPGGQASVADLVRARMGRRVLERLVAPVVGGVHSADPAMLDADMVAPGLRRLMAQEGSLAAAVAVQRGASRGQKAGSAVAGISGGLHRIVAALVRELEADGVRLELGQRVDRLDRSAGDGGAVLWRVGAVAPAGDGPEDAPARPEEVYEAEVVVVALGGPAAVELLSDAVPALAGQEPVPGPEVKLVTLVLDCPALDARPRGTGVLVAPQVPGIRAKALTHATAKWDWLAARAGEGTHVVRLSYGRAGDPPAGIAEAGAEPETDDELFAAAVEDASALLGVAVSPDDVLGWDVVRWEGALPFATVGHRDRVAAIRRLVAAQPGLAVVGGWAAGNGLAAVIPDARSQAAAVASALARTGPA
ncbi:protoporphyrinogen oxidase [Sinomonas atrocyanea]|uniref:Coproporphyrinogen III oxidase n=1 Tax=Sinomonas atrocyanea TaxID=37927 RepID=A0A127A3Y8_9MICC|nr:protoporphyrinogen oxidase [Sinomonas atrocyanea]AMM33355.1 protoporphyrinogen oxidase [Sinomonas atrocyanea]GEB64905.1 protoporphyrinogen oxidase [Sinomonas atrocyanea]